MNSYIDVTQLADAFHDVFKLPVLQPSGNSGISIWFPPRQGFWYRRVSGAFALLCLDDIVLNGLKRSDALKLQGLDSTELTHPSNIILDKNQVDSNDALHAAQREWDRRNFLGLKILFNTVSDRITIANELEIISQRSAHNLWAAIVNSGLFDRY
ncbi:hypothetical protein E3P92_00523 [Wallemia ichthyophaga]|uniref:Uncharacterized protein n=1 Tax=Wallemia ichthyophaga TaxID=245174 RepID=A0A4T0GPV1_WALIC|nr:hypothetical protein E3P97_00264 [Wallemia ichthyophaga]TIB04209.1 hypothetical protein E3P94_00729 [Wallemia ichthyophaga]TIB18768.1 hypothetical protein E3P92_00523 [Wallemia ichthyophaga]TIB38646.1 hypothetical protein E3P86_01515 [Wallemia ichthyophaga]TIB50935.1 hypothetical protein E3P82_00264 [Wallemia ichthyophaga]